MGYSMLVAATYIGCDSLGYTAEMLLHVRVTVANDIPRGDHKKLWLAVCVFFMLVEIWVEIVDREDYNKEVEESLGSLLLFLVTHVLQSHLHSKLSSRCDHCSLSQWMNKPTFCKCMPVVSYLVMKTSWYGNVLNSVEGLLSLSLLLLQFPWCY